METFDITKYLDIAVRRRYWIIIPFLLVLLAGLAHGITATRMYRGETLILVVPQKVPENYVRSIVQLSMEERLGTIKQQVTSRTNLERIIEEYQLFDQDVVGPMIMQEKVDLFKSRIQISVARGTAFTIAFIYEDPQKARDVTNRLAGNFISENLKLREDRALGTSRFLSDEVESVRQRLEEKEQLLTKYREQHLGQMPDNLQTNLSVLGRLQDQLAELNSNLRAAEERKLTIQQQVANAALTQKQMAGMGLSASPAETEISTNPQSTDSARLTSLRNELSLLQERYTENHPDVRRLKMIIAKIEAEEAPSAVERPPDVEPNSPVGETVTSFSMVDLLRPQLEQVTSEIDNLRAEIANVKSQMELYERRVEETPKREQELIALNRGYENLKQLYDSLLKRKLEADIALSMENKQKGEQFQIIDPAKFPERPFRPNLLKILLMATVLGLGLGGGFAFLTETRDTSYRTPDDLEKELQMPVLVSLPFSYTEREKKTQKVKEIFKAASVAVGFVVCGVGIVLGTKGVDKTISFAKDFLTSLGVL